MNKKDFWEKDETTNLIKRIHQMCEEIISTSTWLDIIMCKLRKIKRIPGERIRVWKTYRNLLKTVETMHNLEFKKVVVHGFYKTIEVTLRKI